MPNPAKQLHQLLNNPQDLSQLLFGTTPAYSLTHTPSGMQRIEPNRLSDNTGLIEQLLPIMEYMKRVGTSPLVPRPGEEFDQKTLLWWLQRQLQQPYQFQPNNPIG